MIIKRINLLILFFIIVVNVMQKCYALQNNNDLLNPVRIENFAYNKVYKIIQKEGYSTTITINTIINSLALGNTRDFQVKQLTNNSVVVYPIKKTSETNIIIKDIDDFAYNFNIKSFNKDSEVSPTLSITVNRPLFNTATENKRKISHKFSVYGVDWNGRDVPRANVENIMPNDVWTDGEYMYLDFRGKDTIPAVEQVIDKINSPVSMNIKNGIMVVFGAKELVLIAGGKVICIKPN